MINIDAAIVEAKITEIIEQIKNKLKIDTIVINETFCPGNFITSQILVTAMGRIADVLNINIPDKCYIFNDKKTLTQLTITQAAQKLIKEAEPIKDIQYEK